MTGSAVGPFKLVAVQPASIPNEYRVKDKRGAGDRIGGGQERPG